MSTIVVVGGTGGTNVGDSFKRASDALSLNATLIDHASAFEGPELLRRLLWRYNRRPWRLQAFSRQVREHVERIDSAILIATGMAPLTLADLRRLSARGIRCILFSTDDPWNPVHRAAWHFEALPAYDTVFTPRRSNISDFRTLGCADVRYLPFGFDDELFRPRRSDTIKGKHKSVLFVGGGDPDRAEFFRDFREHGCPLTLVGSYWERYRGLAELSRGHLSPERLLQETEEATVNLCLVRRANRDGHVMRSFEIPAVGGFMLAEDTTEHREIFGSEGQFVLYFRTPHEAADKARWAMLHSCERQRMAEACHRRIVEGSHTYRDRLITMLESRR